MSGNDPPILKKKERLLQRRLLKSDIAVIISISK